MVFVPSPNTTQTVHSDDDGGWTSTGGGELIVDRYNPWFIGKETVKWCLDHNSKYFSLSKEKSKVEIEKAIGELSKQFEIANRSYSKRSVYDPLDIRRYSIKECGVAGVKRVIRDDTLIYRKDCKDLREPDDPVLKKISTNYSFVEDCKEADLVFILGNIQNPKIKKYIQNYGESTFRNSVGFTIRTEYSQFEMRGKGFIYIAGDKGDYSYSGQRRSDDSSQTIWDYVDKLPENTPFPKYEKVFPFSEEYPDLSEYNFKDHIIGPLRPVIFHELGHVFGLRHHNRENMMNEDAPAISVARGFVSEGTYQNYTQVINNAHHALYEKQTQVYDSVAHFSGTNLDPNNLPKDILRDKYPSLYKAIFDGVSEDQYIADIILSLNFDFFADQNTVDFLTFSSKEGEFNSSARFSFTPTEQAHVYNRHSSNYVNFRYAYPKTGDVGSLEMIKLWDKVMIVGYLEVDGKELECILEYDYFGDSSLKFHFNENGTEFDLFIRTSSNLVFTFDDEPIKPKLKFGGDFRF